MIIRYLLSAILAVSVLTLRAVCATLPVTSDPVIVFRQGGDVLYPDYKSNSAGLQQLETVVARHENAILSGDGHIRLVACLAPAEKDDPVAINLAATRAAVVRTHLRNKFRALANKNFAFYLSTDAAANSVQAAYATGRIPAGASGKIHYSTRKNDVAAIRIMLSKYGGLPFISAPGESAGACSATISVAPSQPDEERAVVAIYFRWDQWALDSLYLSNRKNLHRLDSILAAASARRIDTLTIAAFASPEGEQAHNRRLSERRAATIRDYIVTRHPGIEPSKIVTEARGENWEGMENFAAGDPALPSREQVLGILRSSMSGQQKQQALTRLNGGKTYYNYILPNYYTYLRLGATVVMSYAPQAPAVPLPAEEPARRPALLAPIATLNAAPLRQSEPAPMPPQLPEAVAGYPLALKTNLLYDLAGAANLGVELPIGGRWSVVGDAAYAYWRAASHLYALQTLEYGLSGRYWLPVGATRKARNPEWDKPLRGWNLGVYGRYWQRYDVQWKDGCQGDGSWSAGITAGYAFPVGRNLSLEAGLGAGYFSTSQYRTYDRPLYDKQGNYHLMWQETGAWSGFTLTKVNFSLVWLIETGRRSAK